MSIDGLSNNDHDNTCYATPGSGMSFFGQLATNGPGWIDGRGERCSYAASARRSELEEGPIASLLNSPLTGYPIRDDEQDLQAGCSNRVIEIDGKVR